MGTLRFVGSMAAVGAVVYLFTTEKGKKNEKADCLSSARFSQQKHLYYRNYFVER